MRGIVHHIDLSVRDLDVSRPFYESVLGFFGYVVSDQHERGVDFDLDAPHGVFCSIGLLEARGANAARAHDRYAPGLHHLAWTADSPADVDAFHEHLTAIGAKVLDPPAAYPRYGEGYYAVFFADPDGLKLEYVFKPQG